MSTTEATVPPGAATALLPTSKIQVHANPRKTVDDESQEALVESIRQHGVLSAITVRRSDDGEGWTLLAGQRRLLAALTVGLEDIPAVVLEDVDLDREQAIGVVENLHRDPLKPMEEAAAFKQASATLTPSQIAAAYSVSEQLVRDRISLLDLPEALHEYVDNGQIPLGSTRVIAKIAQHNKKLADACAEAALNGKAAIGQFSQNPPWAIQNAVRYWNTEHPDDMVLAFNVTDREIHLDKVPWTDEQRAELEEVAQFVIDSYNWEPLLNAADIVAARSYGALLEIESTDGDDSAFVTDPGWLFEYGSAALARRAEQLKTDQEDTAKSSFRTGTGRKKKKADMNEAELAAYTAQREQEAEARHNAFVDNEKLGANLLGKFSPKLDKQAMLTLALLVGEKWAEAIGRGCRYTVAELRTVTEKKSGGVRVEYASPTDAYEWWLKRLKRLKGPEEIVHHVLFGLASAEFCDENAVPQSQRSYASPPGYVGDGQIAKNLLALTRASLPPRMKQTAADRIKQHEEDIKTQKEWLKTPDTSDARVSEDDDPDLEFDPETGEYI